MHVATSPLQPGAQGKDNNPPLRAVTFNFTGKVAEVTDRGGLLDGSVQAGSPLTGSYTIDPTTPDSNNDPTVGDYWHKAAGYGLLVKIGKYEFKTDPARVHFLLEVVNRAQCDNYLLRSYHNVSSGPGLPADAVDHIAWQLDDPTGKALHSDALPLAPPVLAAWQSIFGLTLDNHGRADGKSGLFIRCHVDFITWDLPGPGQLQRPPPRKLTAKELETAWADLAGDDVLRGYKAALTLLAGPAESVPFLQQRLQPAAVDAKRLANLLADLDSGRYEVRNKATRELEALGEAVEANLRQALAGPPPAEVHARLKQLLKKLEGPPLSRERLRMLRALRVLDHLGSPEALEALRALARHEPSPWLAQQAGAAADRLSLRLAKKP
jgi:hypothetical protein